MNSLECDVIPVLTEEIACEADTEPEFICVWVTVTEAEFCAWVAAIDIKVDGLLFVVVTDVGIWVIGTWVGVMATVWDVSAREVGAGVVWAIVDSDAVDNVEHVEGIDEVHVGVPATGIIQPMKTVRIGKYI